MMTETETVNDLTQARLNALFELKEWQKLLIHFDLAPDTFAFIPLIVPDSSWAELCQKALADFLSKTEKKELLVIHLETPDELKNLASTFFGLKPKNKTGAVWISAPIPFRNIELEEWQAAWREGMARLNQYRNPFREKFDIPVLLVGAEWIKEITRNMAPDLWSVLTILVRIEPPAISVGELQKAETAISSQQFEGWRGVDPYFALQEAERLRGKKGQELGLVRILYRAANGFDARAKYREALQCSTEAAEIVEKLVNSLAEANKNEIESFYADILNIKGNALANLGRLNEAVAEYDKAIEILEELVKEKGRLELANDLAAAYVNKGNALQILGRLDEAVTEFDKAIEIREELVKEKGRLELANYLAGAYMNKGIAFKNLGRLNEAVTEYDKAIEILEELVKEKGRLELANNLAMVYMNKGVAIWKLGRLDEAVTEFDKAIEIREELVKEKGRFELASDLAKAYMNKGLALEDVPDLENALVCFDEGIEWQEKCLARGEHHVLPDYVKGLAFRVRVSIKLEDWQLTANDVVNAYSYSPLLESPEVPDYFKQRIERELGNIIRLLKEVPANREEIYKNAGEMSDVIRQFVEDFGENQQDSAK